MRLYAIAMTIHILGLIALFGGFAMQQRAGALIRKAGSFADARPWSLLLTATRPMVPSGVVMLLLSGGYLAARAWKEPPTWVMVAVLTVLFVITVTLAVTNRGYGAIARALATGEGALSASAARAIANPAMWAALCAANGAALGVIWLMTSKPVLLEAALVVLAGALVGGFVGMRLGRNAGAAAAEASTA